MLNMLLPSVDRDRKHASWKTHVYEDHAAEPPQSPRTDTTPSARNAQPQPKSVPINDWLKSVHSSLESYAVALSNLGYVDSQCLQDAEAQELIDALDKTEMTTAPQRRMFKAACGEQFGIQFS